MSLATLKMIDDLLKHIDKTSFFTGSVFECNQRLCVDAIELEANLYKIYSHLEESLKRDGQSLIEDVEDKS